MHISSLTSVLRSTEDRVTGCFDAFLTAPSCGMMHEDAAEDTVKTRNSHFVTMIAKLRICKFQSFWRDHVDRNLARLGKPHEVFDLEEWKIVSIFFSSGAASKVSGKEIESLPCSAAAYVAVLPRGMNEEDRNNDQRAL